MTRVFEGSRFNDLKRRIAECESVASVPGYLLELLDMLAEMESVFVQCTCRTLTLNDQPLVDGHDDKCPVHGRTTERQRATMPLKERACALTGCEADVAFECKCPRCRHESEDADKFFSCTHHLADAGEVHMRIRERPVHWAAIPVKEPEAARRAASILGTWVRKLDDTQLAVLFGFAVRFANCVRGAEIPHAAELVAEWDRWVKDHAG
jgi:hypothetical protein